jgi:hypothetical protein
MRVFARCDAIRRVEVEEVGPTLDVIRIQHSAILDMKGFNLGAQLG